MKTLYDLLGALPDDDAEGLRSAFRRAVKGAHPDIRKGDPDAALKFREIVRANEILCDPEQRQAYDYLLELAHLEREPVSQHALATRIYKLASGVIALSAAAVIIVGGYLLFLSMSSTSLVSASARSLQGPEIIAHNGDANGSAADFDRASQLDAKILPAYVGPDFCRRGNPDGALPDAAPANPNRLKSTPAVARKQQRRDQSTTVHSVTLPAQRQTAAADPFRQQTVAQMR